MDVQQTAKRFGLFTLIFAALQVGSIFGIVTKSDSEHRQLFYHKLAKKATPYGKSSSLQKQNIFGSSSQESIDQRPPESLCNGTFTEACPRLPVTSNMADRKPGGDNHRHRRQKREVKNFDIKLLLVIDVSVSEVWFDRMSHMNDDWRNQVLRLMGDFYPAIVNTMNAQLRTLNIPNISLRVSLADFYINANPKAKIHRGSKNREKILEDFEEWLKHQKFPPYDHAILLINNNLIEKDRKKHKDTARLSTICTNRSVSVIPENFDSTTITTATHELAHSLGIRHDGDGNDCVSHYHLMTDNWMALRTKTPISLRQFSPCSGHYVADKLQQNEKSLDCLENSFVPSKPSLLPGQILNADLQCRYAIGANSYVCRSVYQSRYDAVCTELWCASENGNCTRIMPYDGTTCGEKKWCSNGVCTEDKKAPFVPDDCPFLDQTSRIPGTNMTCDQVSKERLWECFQPAVALACCYICPTKKCNDDTCCIRDDRHSQCATLHSYACYSRDMPRICCKTCKKLCSKNIPDCSCGDKRVNCVNISRIDCYTKHDQCCESCSQLRNLENPDCEYGDRSGECSVENCIYYDSYRLTKVCCETCSDFKPEPITESTRLEDTSNAITLKGPVIWIPFITINLFSFMLY